MARGFGKNTNRRLQDKSPVDRDWPEVKFINNYAVFMGYLSMAVMGTGILVFTWSTVVLLGGFVTMLAKEDFWSLTVITLVQTRVFDVFLKGNISNIGYSFTRLGEAALYVGLTRKDRYRLSSVRGMVRLLVFTILLCPLFALYMFGLFVSPWISLWRLWRTIRWQGYPANLKPALLVLYSLALLQGMLFYYWVVSKSEEKKLVKQVAEAYEIEEDKAGVESVSDYLRQIREACEKDPSFARGRNFVTYAVDMMESKSPDNHIHGAKILDTLIQQINISTDKIHDREHKRIIKRIKTESERRKKRRTESEQEQEQEQEQELEPDSGSNNDAEIRFSITVVQLPRYVVKTQKKKIDDMIRSSSSSDTIKNIVRMLDTKKKDDQETWFCAMRIVAHFAEDISLDNIMNGIRSISSLLEYKGSSELEVFCAGMEILSDLANNQENLRLMSSTAGVTKNIVTVIIRHHREDESHNGWLSMAKQGMQLIHRVMSDSASSKSNNVRHVKEILDVTGGITTLKDMLDCPKCKGGEDIHKWLIQVLTQVIISVMSIKDPSSLKNEEDYKVLNEKFTKWLVVKFLHGSGKKSFRKLAGESLAKLSLTRDLDPIKRILNADRRLADSLANVLLEDNNIKYRKSAADILEHLCRHYQADKAIQLADQVAQLADQAPQADKTTQLADEADKTTQLADQAAQMADNTVKNFKNLKDAMVSEIPKVLKRLIPGADPEYETKTSNVCSWSYSDYVEEQVALASLCATVDKMIPKSPFNLDRRKLDKEAAQIRGENNIMESTFDKLLDKAKEEVETLKKILKRDSEFQSYDDDDYDSDN